jgi:hypothetical protein
MSQQLPKELVVLTRAHQLLSEARTFQDFKAIRKKAEMARLFAKTAELGLEVQIRAAELKLECERRAGLALREIELSQGGRPGKKNRSHVGTGLEELGISKNQSSRWQREAQIPEEEFSRYLDESRAAHREPTSQGLLRLAKQRTEEAKQGAHWHTKKRPRQRASQSMILNSPKFNSALSFPIESEEDALIADLQSHHQQLANILADYYGTGQLVAPRPAQRRYVGQLLNEMGKLLETLRVVRRRH